MPKKIDKEKQDQLNPDNLYDLYCVKKMTLQSIADLIGVSLGTVRLNLIKNNIEIRNKKVKLKSGMKFGMLTTKKFLRVNKDGTEIWECKCECGKLCESKSTSLISGHKQSCGCLKNSGLNKKHNLSNSRIYGIHQKIISRCYKEYEKTYKHYGGRGIKVCDEWMGESGFINFYNWAMHNGYNDNLTIDRIDVNGNYCPDNCRWATSKVQQNNRRNNRIIEFDGKKYTLTELAEEFDISVDRLSARLKLGWNLIDALTIPKRKNKFI